MGLERTIVALAKHMLNELKYLAATPRDTEQDIKLASEYGITTDDLRSNEIANKMIEIKTLTQIALIDDGGLSNEAVSALNKIDETCNSLLRTNDWIS